MCSESGASVNRVVVVVANTMAPFDRDVLPRDVFDGIEMEMDCMVRRVSSVLTPRPTRTMISVNCTEEMTLAQPAAGDEKMFRGYVRRCPESVRERDGRASTQKQESMRRGINDRFRAKVLTIMGEVCARIGQR